MIPPKTGWLAVIPIALFLVFVTMYQPAYATCSSGLSPIGETTLRFDFCDYGRDFLGPGTGAAIITVTDSSANTNPTAIDTVPVTITSGANPTGIQLTLQETGVNTGVFTGQVEFMTGNYLFPQSTSITVTENYVNCPPPYTSAGCPAPTTLSEDVRSDHTGANPITITLPETGTNTGVYQGKLSFSGFSSSTQNTIFAQGGDYVQYSTLGAATWMLITPNSDSSKGAIQVNSGTDDIITATYSGFSAQVTEGLRYGGGGGGGGVVAPSLVLDVAAGVGGGGPPPPSFSFHGFTASSGLSSDVLATLADQDPFTAISPTTQMAPFYPLTIDGRGYLLGNYADTLQTVSEQVGKPMTISLTTISRPVVHVSLFTNLHSLYDTMTDSDTYIIYDTGKPLQVVDPHGFFANVTMTPVINGTRQSFVYDITFAKPMGTSNIMVRAWDDKLSSTDLTLFDAWNATDVSVTSKATQNAEMSSSLLTQKIPPQVQNTTTVVPASASTGLVDTIKEWGGYSSTSVSDSQLLGTVGIDGKFIPPWFMHTAKWVVQGEESEQSFVDGIKYLYQKGLIH